LARKGFGREVVGSLVEGLKRIDLIDDAKFARYFASQRMSARPVGRRALVASLKARGIAPDVVAQAVERATEGRSEMETARELALGRWSALKGLDQATRVRRLVGFLSRRGFSSEVVYRVAREVHGGSFQGRTSVGDEGMGE
jgi:regulatory protein